MNCTWNLANISTFSYLQLRLRRCLVIKSKIWWYILGCSFCCPTWSNIFLVGGFIFVLFNPTWNDPNLISFISNLFKIYIFINIYNINYITYILQITIYINRFHTHIYIIYIYIYTYHCIHRPMFSGSAASCEVRSELSAFIDEQRVFCGFIDTEQRPGLEFPRHESDMNMWAGYENHHKYP